jgi:hypothetical protein
MVDLAVEHNRRSTWRCPLREPRDTALVGDCSEITEQEGTVRTIHIQPHLTGPPNVIHECEHLSGGADIVAGTKEEGEKI